MLFVDYLAIVESMCWAKWAHISFAVFDEESCETLFFGLPSNVATVHTRLIGNRPKTPLL